MKQQTTLNSKKIAEYIPNFITFFWKQNLTKIYFLEVWYKQKAIIMRVPRKQLLFPLK